MATVCPTITESTIEDYNNRIDTLATFAERFHPDLMDGEFAPSTSLPLEQIHWPDSMKADIHIMYQRPTEQLETLIALKPHMVVFHAEADGDLLQLTQDLQAVGIKAGVALLQETTVDSQSELIRAVDHVLVFSGNLGYHGGTVDFGQAKKIPQIKAINPKVEIGWDGGVNDKHAKELVEAGVDVLNSGGFIAHADDQAAAYQKIIESIS